MLGITTKVEEADEATKLEYSASDIEKCTVEENAVVAKGEAAKDVRANEEGEEICSQRTYENTQKSLHAITAAQICISTSSEEADEATKLPKLPIIPLI